VTLSSHRSPRSSPRLVGKSLVLSRALWLTRYVPRRPAASPRPPASLSCWPRSGRRSCRIWRRLASRRRRRRVRQRSRRAPAAKQTQQRRPMSLLACRVKGAAQCSSAGVSPASLVVPCLADPDVHLLVSLARAGPSPSSALPRSSCIGLPSTSSAESGKAGDRCACTRVDAPAPGSPLVTHVRLHPSLALRIDADGSQPARVDRERARLA